MSEQRIDTGADAATSGDEDLPQPGVDRGSAATADSGDTEGESYLRDTQAKQDGGADLGGRMASDSGSASGSGSGSGSGDGSRPDREPTAETGEVSAAPSEERRQEDPGSVATEFGDRADVAPDDDVAHPSI
jgi:copper transport protein